MVLMIALVLVSILAIAVVPASAAITPDGAPDKAMMLVANNGKSDTGVVIVSMSETLNAGDTVLFDVDYVDSGAVLEVKVGDNVLSTADGNAKTYWHYKLEITADAITLTGSDDGLVYTTVDSKSASVTDAVLAFSLTDGNDRLAKQAFIDNISMPSGKNYDFNYVDDAAASTNGGNTDAEIDLSEIYASDFVIIKTGYSDAYLHQEEFYVNFYDIAGGATIKSVYVGYGKRVAIPSGYALVDATEQNKIDKVETDSYIAVTKTSDAVLGGYYVRLINGTFADGKYAGFSFGIFQAGTSVNVVADSAPSGTTFNAWFNGVDFNDTDEAQKLSKVETYSFTVDKNVTLSVDYNYPTYDIYVNDELFTEEETGDAYTMVAPTRPGYVFKGWYNDADFTDLITLDTSFDINMDSDKSFYAKYEAIIYPIVVNSGYIAKINDTEYTQADNKTVTDAIYGDVITIIPFEAEEGKHFMGWYAGAIQRADKTTVEGYTFTVNGKLTLNAKYDLNPVEVTVIGGIIDGYESESSDEYKVTVSIDETVTFIPVVPEGKEFVNWKIGEDTVEYVNYSYKVKGEVVVEAIYKDKVVVPEHPETVTVTVNGGTIQGATGNSKTVAYDTSVTVVAGEAPEGKEFGGWYEGTSKKSSSVTYTFKAKKNITLTAKYVDIKPDAPKGGCGGFIAPTTGSNGGNLGGMIMILGILVLATLAVVFARRGKNIVKHASKVLGVVLCLAVLCGAIVVPEAVATETELDRMETLYESKTYTIEHSNESFIEYFPVEGFKLGDKVKVSMKVNINRLSSYENGWSTAQFINLGGEVIDDALPVNTWTNLVYETRVISTDDGFAVALAGNSNGYLLMDVKNVVVTDSKLTANLLGGATLYMLPNDEDTSDEQMNSFVLVTASKKVIVMDGGTFKDYVYLRDFLYSITDKVDAWFISHYHSDHIGALAIMLYNRDIEIDTLYYDFVDHEDFYGPIAKKDMVLSGTFNFDFDNKQELVDIIGPYSGGNSGTVLNNFLRPIYTRKYGECVGEATKDTPSALYLMFYDEVQRNLALAEDDAGRIIGNVVKTRRGDVISFDDVEFRVLNDVQSIASNYGNNATINWRINTAGVDMLFLGDSGTEVGNILMEDVDKIFTEADGTKTSVADNLLGCTIVQAAHHGQNGTSRAFYENVMGDIYIYCAPENLFYTKSGNNGLIGSDTTQCVKEREWQRQMNVVSKTFWMDGLVTIR